MTTTVLLADDFGPFREFVCEMLQTNPDIRIVSEVGDGLRAVQKADELKPDLILLDVDLPTLNGLEAARQIRGLSPESKIVFVSGEFDTEVVREALETGAHGYVVKADVGGELLAAVDTVLQGERFVGNRFAVSDFYDDVNGAIPSADDSVRKVGHCTTRASTLHEAVVYCKSASCISTFTQFMSPALNAGDALIVSVTKSRRDTIVRHLLASGIDLDVLIEQGRYISVNPAELLSTFMSNGLPERDRFLRIAGNLITTAQRAIDKEHNYVAICGECVPLLWSQGNAKGAIQLERLWNELATLHKVHVLCGHPLASFQGGSGSYVLGEICAEHSAVYYR